MQVFAARGYEALEIGELFYMLSVVGRKVDEGVLRDMLSVLVAKGYAEWTRSGRIQLTP